MIKEIGDRKKARSFRFLFSTKEKIKFTILWETSVASNVMFPENFKHFFFFCRPIPRVVNFRVCSFTAHENESPFRSYDFNKMSDRHLFSKESFIGQNAQLQ